MIRTLAVGVVMLGALPFAVSLTGQNVDPGRKAFESRCARCHGGDGNGGEMGPAIAERLSARDDKQLAELILRGVPERGMPPAVVPDAEMADLLKYLRSIERRPESKPIVRTTVSTADGKTLAGQVLSEGFGELQLLTDDKRVHLLRADSGTRMREVTSQGLTGPPTTATPAASGRSSPAWCGRRHSDASRGCRCDGRRRPAADSWRCTRWCTGW